MRINTNIASLTAQRALANTTRAFARALERLSSGKRINRAGDDAAGLAISERLKSQVGGMNRAALNVNEAYGFLNTADGALANQIDLVQRMRELALQSANGTLSTADRSYLDDEFQTLLAEFERVAEQSEFNGVKLLDGSLSTIELQVGTEKGQSIAVNLEGSRTQDILESYNTSTVPDGVFTASTPMTYAGGNQNGPAVGDINGDGHDDVLLTDLSTPNASLFWGNGDGSFTAGTAVNTGEINPKMLVLDDLNNDDKLDLILCGGFDNQLIVKMGNGDGTFGVSTAYALTNETNNGVRSKVQTEDLNGDGNMDVIVAEFGQTYISVFMGNGDGSLQSRVTYATGGTTGVLGFSFADINGDGGMDIITANGVTDHTVSYLLNQGNGLFGAASTQSVVNAASVGFEDFDGDGDMDMVVGRITQVQVFSNNGSGSFTAGTAFATENGHESDPVMEDLNGDGAVDIAISDRLNSLTSIWYGNGDGSFQARVTLASGNAWLVPGDFNDDGITDLLSFASAANPKLFLQGSTETEELIPRNLQTQESSQNVLAVLDAGLEALLDRRASLGAQMNRLEYAGSNLRIGVENLSAARSQIIDADIAEETAELTRAQILQQAGVSVLGQANTSLQMVLGLLRF